MSAVELGSITIKEALNRAKIPLDTVDHVFMGCVIQAGLGQNVARQASLKAGLPVSTTAQTVNVVCAFGLDAINSTARMIQCGDADIVVAGGMESMSNASFAIMKGRFGYKMGSPMKETPIVVKNKEEMVVDKDEAIRPNLTLEKLSNLNPAFKEGGKVTAGNSSGISDGASGCRIVVTLIYALKQQNKKTGLATLCIGGGMGCSTLIRRCE